MKHYLAALGANEASAGHDVASSLLRAVEYLDEAYNLSLLQVSTLFRTPAWPPASGPDYVNAAAAFVSDLPPGHILEVFHEVEARFGRTRSVRWGPRPMDLDLLAQEDLIQPDRDTVLKWLNKTTHFGTIPAPDELILPHPRLHERAFVLGPLCDISPSWVHPILGKSAAQMWADLPESDRQAIRPLG